MPYLSVQTNVSVADEAELLTKLSKQASRMLGKPESYVMVHIEAGAAMLFAGSAEPLAYVELKSLGLSEGDTPAFSAGLCSLLQDELGLDAGRIYIEFSGPERHMWGWNGSTF
jgi:phenylpyruvate tautomerase PptA (4-oxalocrotonate tautomerase family)